MTPPTPDHHWRFIEHDGEYTTRDAIANVPLHLDNPGGWGDGAGGPGLRFSPDRVHRAILPEPMHLDVPWSVCCWVWRSGETPHSTLLDSRAFSVRLEQYQTQRFGFTIYGDADYSFDYAVPIHQWTHIALVATRKEMTLYVNGHLADALTVPSKGLPVFALERIGTQGSRFRRSPAAAIADLQIFRSTLYWQHVAAIHAAGTRSDGKLLVTVESEPVTSGANRHETVGSLEDKTLAIEVTHHGPTTVQLTSQGGDAALVSTCPASSPPEPGEPTRSTYRLTLSPTHHIDTELIVRDQANNKFRYLISATRAGPRNVLRHAVFFSFFEKPADGSDVESNKRAVVEDFCALPAAIPQLIHDFEWGENTSSKADSGDYTHCFFVTFEDEASRHDYVFVNEAHRNFVNSLGNRVNGALVIDYWASAREPASQRGFRHFVFFTFKDEIAAESVRKAEADFAALADTIVEISAFEWGTNNSPETVDHGFTHCFMLTFDSPAHHQTYLAHPARRAFLASIESLLAKECRLSYRAREHA